MQGVNFIKGTLIELEPAESLYTVLSGSLRAYAQAKMTPGTRRWQTELFGGRTTGGWQRP